MKKDITILDERKLNDLEERQQLNDLEELSRIRLAEYEQYEQSDNGEYDTCPNCGGVYFSSFSSPSSIEGELCCDSCISRWYED